MLEDLACSGKRSSTTRQNSHGLPELEESIDSSLSFFFEDIGGSGKTKKLKKENVNDFISSRVIIMMFTTRDSALASQTEKDESGGDRQFRAHPTETISLISIDDQNALQAEMAEPQKIILDAHFTCGNERGGLALFRDDSIQASNDSQSKLIERDSSDMESVASASGTNSRMPRQQSLALRRRRNLTVRPPQPECRSWRGRRRGCGCDFAKSLHGPGPRLPGLGHHDGAGRGDS